jgi:Ni/Fe-hydrogenase 1 B-type cytochrome subunit
MNSNVASGVHDPVHQKAVYVFEAPVRVWHWLHTFSFLILAVTGYLISQPLPSLAGEASDHFLMGNIRLIHFIAAYVFAIGFAVRIYWALVGNRHAREIFYLPLWRPSWWVGLIHEIKFYLFLTRKQDKTLGHNPLAQVAMFFLNTLMTLFMIGTGFALYGEGLGGGSWADRLFGWIIPLLGDGQAARNWHDMGMWIMIMFVIIHIYMAVRADIIGRESSVSTMIGGWRLFKDDLP